MSEGFSTDEQGALAAVKLAGIQKQLNAESWGDHAEDMMKSWGEKAAGLRWMHQKQAGVWKAFADKLTLWGIGITTFVSSASLITAGIEDAEYVMYGIGGVGMIASLIQAIKKFYNAEDKVAEHTAIAKRFGSFYRAMTLELGTSRADRRSSDIVFEWASKEYDQLQKDAPSIGGDTIKAYKEIFGRQKNLPDIAEDVFIIEVHDRPETSEEHFFNSLKEQDLTIDDNLGFLSTQTPNRPVNIVKKNNELEARLESSLESSLDESQAAGEAQNNV